MITLVKGSERLYAKNFDELYEMFKDVLEPSETLMEYVLSNYELFVNGLRYET